MGRRWDFEDLSAPYVVSLIFDNSVSICAADPVVVDLERRASRGGSMCALRVWSRFSGLTLLPADWWDFEDLSHPTRLQDWLFKLPRVALGQRHIGSLIDSNSDP